MEQTPLIRAANITTRFPGTLALESVNFELAQGEIHSLCGENGAGKSTLMMIMAGVHQMDGGSLFFTDGTAVISIQLGEEIASSSGSGKQGSNSSNNKFLRHGFKLLKIFI